MFTKMTTTRFFSILLCAFVVSASFAEAADFSSKFEKLDRVWVGAEYWANPLQDWRVKNDRLECSVSGGNRNVFLLTHHAGTEKKKSYEMSVTLGRLDAEGKKGPVAKSGWGGFRIGIKGTLPDYRNAALFGKGLEVGVRTDGSVFVDSVTAPQKVDMSGTVTLKLSVSPTRKEPYAVILIATDASGKSVQAEAIVKAERVEGHFALVSDWSKPKPAKKKGRKAPRFNPTARGGDVRFWFANWKVEGSKIEANEDHAFGPILHAQYTLSRGVMKLTAQMPPVGKKESQVVRLSVKPGGQGEWKSLGEAKIDPLARTARFRQEKWDDGKDTPYRLTYRNADGSETHFDGTIRKDPVDKETIVVAGFTGNTDYIFPDTRIANNVAVQNPDLLFFSGDQIYESVAGYGIQRTDQVSVEVASLDYLRKWWLVGWAWADLMKDRPSVYLPDDHDVYQGNIWGAGGRKSTRRPGFDDGGYGMDAKWVNVIQRTQTSHHPDPFDPTPIEQGIEVYYGEMNYGHVSFAVIEDRKFKTGPATALPNKKGRSDHVRPQDVDEKTWDPKTIDVPVAKLLGDRQLKFLDHWAADWSKADFKVLLSQTIFANVANYHGANREYLIADLDSNGWPQTGRNKALATIRRGFAFNYAGDQHLASIVHHGIDAHGDSGWSFCVPSISAGYPRSWHPEKPWPNHVEGAADYTGEFKEGFGNRITVHAVGNPEDENRKDSPEMIGHDKASGYGIVRLNKKTREITMECYKLLTDAANPKAGDQFPGWPKTISMEENYGRKATGYLPTLKISGMKNAVVQVIDEGANQEVVYTLRIKGSSFRPKVFSEGPFTVIVGEPSAGKTKKLSGVKVDEKGRVEVKLD